MNQQKIKPASFKLEVEGKDVHIKFEGNLNMIINGIVTAMIEEEKLARILLKSADVFLEIAEKQAEQDETKKEEP